MRDVADDDDGDENFAASQHIRQEIPNHLRSAIRVLQSVSLDFKTRPKEARWNILFDDDCMELVLDFTLGKGKPWKRLYTAQAMSRKKKNGPLAIAARRETELDEILGYCSDDCGDDVEEEHEGPPPRKKNRLRFGGCT